MRPTMTVHECCEALRANLVPISEDSLMSAIEAGRFPWADSIPGKNSRKALIWRKLFYEWLEPRLTDNMIRFGEADCDA